MVPVLSDAAAPHGAAMGLTIANVYFQLLRILKLLKKFSNSFVNGCVLQALLLLSVLSLCFSFKLGFILFFLEPFSPTTAVTAWSDTISIMLPITYLQTILQKRLLEHPAFGCSCNRIYPPREKLDLCAVDFTPSLLFWHCLHTFNIHSLHSYPGSCRVYKS